jgi:hypothetical protein
MYCISVASILFHGFHFIRVMGTQVPNLFFLSTILRFHFHVSSSLFNVFQYIAKPFLLYISEVSFLWVSVQFLFSIPLFNPFVLHGQSFVIVSLLMPLTKSEFQFVLYRFHL